MGPLGAQEIMFIFILALLLFGPKKLPEIGRTIGKAITEFRRASSELRETFHREMQNLERETESIKEGASPYQYDTYSYDYSSHETPADGTYGAETDLAASPSNESASAPQGAELPPAGAPEGSLDQTFEEAAQAAPDLGVDGQPSSPAEIAESAAAPVDRQT
jgi:TatA/E family protein of Tat protein translocase